MKITLELLKDLDACQDGLDWFKKNIKEPIEHDELINRLIEYDIGWTIWLIVRLLTHKNKIILAIYAARKILPIFEEKYPNNNRPRKAIDDAEKYLNKKISIGELIKSRDEAYAASQAARAAYADDSSHRTAYAAAYSASQAAYAVYATAKAADAVYATAVATYVVYAAVDAAVDAVNKKTSLIDTINYGLELMKNNEG